MNIVSKNPITTRAQIEKTLGFGATALRSVEIHLIKEFFVDVFCSLHKIYLVHSTSQVAKTMKKYFALMQNLALVSMD